MGGYYESRDFDANGEGIIFGSDAPGIFGSPADHDETFADLDQTTLAVFGQARYQHYQRLCLWSQCRWFFWSPCYLWNTGTRIFLKHQWAVKNNADVRKRRVGDAKTG
ncbi:MAG: hypothetical protein AAF572_20580 [Cyanobacteria bacterium P01_B01_bin.77]